MNKNRAHFDPFSYRETTYDILTDSNVHFNTRRVLIGGRKDRVGVGARPVHLAFWHKMAAANTVCMQCFLLTSLYCIISDGFKATKSFDWALIWKVVVSELTQCDIFIFHHIPRLISDTIISATCWIKLWMGCVWIAGSTPGFTHYSFVTWEKSK